MHTIVESRTGYCNEISFSVSHISLHNLPLLAEVQEGQRLAPLRLTQGHHFLMLGHYP